MTKKTRLNCCNNICEFIKFRKHITTEGDDCPICLQYKQSIKTKCKHNICIDCMLLYCKKYNSCPICRNDYYLHTYTTIETPKIESRMDEIEVVD